MTVAVYETERFLHMEKVAELKMKGVTDTAIANQLGLKRKDVLELFSEYKDTIANDAEARDMARDHLHQMVKHYDSLIKKSYDLLDELEALAKFDHWVAAQRNSGLKLIADLEAKRLDALQKAGLLDSAELGDELAEAEEKQQIIIDILENDLCPACKQLISGKIMKLTGRVPVIEAVVVD